MRIAGFVKSRILCTGEYFRLEAGPKQNLIWSTIKMPEKA